MSVQRQHGFTLIELVVVIIIISGLLYFAFARLLKLEVQAERAALQQVIGILNSAIAMTISKHIADGDIPSLRNYIDSNPMDLLAQTPPNYLGSFEGAPPQPGKGAYWYFDRHRHSLVYVTGSPEYFSSEGPENDRTGFKLVAVYDDNRGNKPVVALAGLRLAATAPYHWHNEPIHVAEFAKPASQ
jgi:prepilin-type N-terminal cleavage/methylation domain-containing protein